VAVRNATTLKLYLNSALIATSDAFTASDYDLSNTVNLLIGSGQQDCFNNTIDEVRIWNRALSGSEIKQLYLSPYDMFIC